MKLKLSDHIVRSELRLAIDMLMVSLLVIFALVWAGNQFLTNPPYVDPDRYPIRGIDVSSHNGVMDLHAAASDGVEFVFIKASEGSDHKDANFKTNYEKARQAGLKTGAYHYFRFDKDGVKQARNFLETLGSRHFDLGIAIDVEEAGNAHGVDTTEVKRRLHDMVDYLNLLGHRVMLYTNRDGYYDYLSDEFQGIPLWICSFNRVPINADWTFWQYDHHGRVKGVKGDVDLNAYVGSRKDWENAFSGKEVEE